MKSNLSSFVRSAASGMVLVLALSPALSTAALVRVDFSVEIIRSADATIEVGSTFTGNVTYDPDNAGADAAFADYQGIYNGGAVGFFGELVLDQFPGAVFALGTLRVNDGSPFLDEDTFEVITDPTPVAGRPVSQVVLSFRDLGGNIATGDDLPVLFAFGDLDPRPDWFSNPNDFLLTGNGAVRGIFTSASATVVPAPGALLLLGTGVSLLGVVRFGQRGRPRPVTRWQNRR